MLVPLHTARVYRSNKPTELVGTVAALEKLHVRFHLTFPRFKIGARWNRFRNELNRSERGR